MGEKNDRKNQNLVGIQLLTTLDNNQARINEVDKYEHIRSRIHGKQIHHKNNKIKWIQKNNPNEIQTSNQNNQKP